MKNQPIICAMRVSQFTAMFIGLVLSLPLYAQNYVVRVFPQNDDTVRIDTGPQGNGATGQGRGYVGYGRNESGWTTFLIRDQNPFKTCADDNGHGQSPWVITGLKLSDTGSNVGGQQKGNGWDTPVPDYVWKSFAPVNPSNGVYYKADKDAAQGFLHVYNYNAHDYVDGAPTKLIYYELELTRCRLGDDGEIIKATADPAWGNDGKK